MPANSKYLTTKGQRAVKIVTALLGGYLLSASFHLFLAVFPATRDVVIILSSFSFFLVWGGLMIVVFLARNAWNALGLFLALTVIFGSAFWILKNMWP
ncbi:hypothetical protein [Leadbetterella sp. DM7]|uniref:hypothetical protein n=1 Tax=Leadbetterella sp. DM7 TaxID=3235085 RepID=UPI00349EC377